MTGMPIRQLFSLLACGALLSGCGGEAPAAKPPAAKAAETRAPVARAPSQPALIPAAPTTGGKPCAPGETLVYACALKATRTVSVCAGDGALIYRFGPAGAPDLILVGRTEGMVHVGTIVGGGGGSQTAIRFSGRGHDYTVWSATYGELTEIAGQKASGVVVEKGDEVVSQLSCKSQGADQEIRNVPDWVPEETEERHLGWF